VRQGATIYPVPHWKLFAIELLLRLASSLEMIMVLAAALVGVVSNPYASPLPVLPAFVIFALFNVLLAAGIRSLLERLLSRKRLREVLVLALVLATAAPRLLVASGVSMAPLEKLFGSAAHFFWPWGAAARLALGPTAGAAFAVLLGWTTIAWLFSRLQFERGLRFDVRAAAATSGLDKPAVDAGSWTEKIYRAPSLLLPDPVSAIIEKEIRSLSRTPRFRVVFIMGFSFGLLIWLPLIMGGRASAHSAVARNFLVVVSAYALVLLGQVSFWNAFGFDRSATQIYFFMPVPVSQTLLGKNLAAVFFILLELAAVMIACVLFRIPVPAEKFLEAAIVIPISTLYVLATGNLSSVYHPRPINPEYASRGGTGKRFQAVLFLAFPLALLPVFLAYLARTVLDSEAAFWGLLAFAGLLGGVVYAIAMESAVTAARSRREMLIMEMATGEGPIAGE
ncbi:MAG: hypothetical protein M1541_16945, partial [Acidobacteria bacterium]|nr:hypothetical protein [Acidobacteriota bacterium]